ncbi:MAG: ACP S-malonyltransferase [Cyanobacteriota bacterium]|nr:ACP S-malonyltransferase [Cyanobacteriota bacterium]
MTMIAWIFPGQGSQAVGMGQEIVNLPGVKPKLALAEKLLGWSWLELNEAQLNRTLYTQPALFLVCALLSDHLHQQAHQPACVAGHSLGEYSALYSAGVFDLETGLQLVKQRAMLMDQATTGMMAAVIGFDRAKLEHLCSTVEGVVIANDNSPDQVVVAGTQAAVQTVTEQLRPKRFVPLPVSGAFHSVLMAPAAAEFASVLQGIPFATPRVPVYSNVSASASQDAHHLKDLLVQQMTSPVRWRETVLQMAADGVTGVWEIGPKSVLTGLVKRTAPALERLNLPDLGIS